MCTFAHMTITNLSSSYFHAMLPDVKLATSAERVKVRIKLGQATLLEEAMYAVGGVVVLQDLPQLLEPWLRDTLIDTFTVLGVELDSVGEPTSVTAESSCQVVYGNVDMDSTCQEFCNSHFLTLLSGEKTTAAGRLEYLHYIGSGDCVVTCRYSDGSSATKSASPVAGNGKFSTIDVSPDRFAIEGKQLVKYAVTVGARSQEYVMDLTVPDCAPILLFTNSFGCQELIYCVGKHEVKPEYSRSAAIIHSRRRNYRIVEQRNFEADTGVLTVGEMNWVDELFRSMEIYVVNFVGGNPRVGREVLMLDSKSEFSNEDDALNKATFRYTYAQRCHNIVDTQRAGRIFDNTFDNTFD